MDDNEMEIFSSENKSRYEDSPSNSDDEDSRSNLGENSDKMQFIGSIDKGYTSAAKSLVFGIVRNHNKKGIDAVHSSLTEPPRIFEKVFNMLTSESFLSAIENRDKKAATKFLKSSLTFCARRYEDSCVRLIDRKFLLNTNNNLSFAERAIKFAAKNRNTKAFSLITSALFLKAVKIGDECSVNRFLNGSRKERSMRSDALCIKSIDKKFIVNVDAFDMDNILGCCISFSDWLEGIAMSPRRILIELFKFEKIVNGEIRDGWTELYVIMHQREFVNFDLDALPGKVKRNLRFIYSFPVVNEQFMFFMRELLEHRVNVNQRNYLNLTALMDACKPGNVAAEIFDWRDNDGEVEFARDENGEVTLSVVKWSDNAEILAKTEQNLFLGAVESGDTKTVKKYLTAKESNLNLEDSYWLYCCRNLNVHQEHNSDQMEIQSDDDDLCEEPPPQSFKEIKAPKDTISHRIWLEAVVVAQHKYDDEMLNLLFTDQRFTHGFNEDGLTFLQQLNSLRQVVADYLATEYNNGELMKIQILLKSEKFRANVLNLLYECMFEIFCKIKPQHKRRHCILTDDLLRIFLQNGIDLNGRNQNGETLLMHACTNKCFDIVDSLLDLTSSGFVLDIDAVDNSGETALMKAKQNNDSKIVAALLRFTLISAVEHGKIDIVKSMLGEFSNTSHIAKLWNSKSKAIFGKNRLDLDHFKIWRDAMDKAIKGDRNRSKNILELLFDCDIVLSQEADLGTPLLHRFIGHGNDVDDKTLRLLEMLLESGKMNVNARDKEGRTALFLAKEEALCLIPLLISNGADVNIKNNEGKTALMSMRDRGDSVLRTILEEAGTSVELHAMDCDGQTALMIATRNARSGVVDLLLSAGASVNVSDHDGFTALHHALCTDNFPHIDFPRKFEELKKRQEMAVLFDAVGSEELNYYYYERMKIIQMLLGRPDVNVNALSFEKMSPLDIAEGWFPETPSAIKDALKEKGAVLNVFRQTELPSTNDFHLDFRCRLTMQELQFEDLDLHKKILRALIEKFKEQIVSGKDKQGRTALHLAIISFSIISLPQYWGIESDNEKRDLTKKMEDLSNSIVKELISLGCSVNETDNFGRTPLHYANTILWNLLKSYGADASIKDKNGKSAIDQTSNIIDRQSRIKTFCDRNKETHFLCQRLNDRKMERNDSQKRALEQDEVKLKTARKFLWEEGEYAFRHPLVRQITKEVTDLMNAIAKEIERLDPRFAIRPELVGSSNEGTRLGKPDEFDFCFVLTKLSELCEVSLSPELPTGFVRLKRKPTNVGERKETDVSDVFRDDGVLNTEKLNSQFTIVLRNAMVNIENQQNFEWNLEVPLQYAAQNFKSQLHAFKMTDTYITQPTKVLQIQIVNTLNFTSVHYITIDIVPCIHVDGFWPDEAISSVSEETKRFGCNLVFGSAKKLHSSVPYTESCARISFSKAESDTIKQSCVKAKEAYMIGKTMIGISEFCSNYSLKNSLLYCIEALTPTAEKASQLGFSLEELESKFHQMDHYLWLECLMKCYFEFVLQDFCPCYFMPNFSLPLGKEHLKECSLDWIMGWYSVFQFRCKNAYASFRWASNNTSESCCQFPAPDPLWERFDRKKLIESLCKIAYK